MFSEQVSRLHSFELHWILHFARGLMLSVAFNFVFFFFLSIKYHDAYCTTGTTNHSLHYCRQTLSSTWHFLFLFFFLSTTTLQSVWGGEATSKNEMTQSSNTQGGIFISYLNKWKPPGACGVQNAFINLKAHSLLWKGASRFVVRMLWKQARHHRGPRGLLLLSILPSLFRQNMFSDTPGNSLPRFHVLRKERVTRSDSGSSLIRVSKPKRINSFQRLRYSDPPRAVALVSNQTKTACSS